jgi:hypothetical protein
MEFGAIQIVSSLEVCDEAGVGTSSSRKFCIKSEMIQKKGRFETFDIGAF